MRLISAAEIRDWAGYFDDSAPGAGVVLARGVAVPAVGSVLWVEMPGPLAGVWEVMEAEPNTGLVGLVKPSRATAG